MEDINEQKSLTLQFIKSNVIVSGALSSVDEHYQLILSYHKKHNIFNIVAEYGRLDLVIYLHEVKKFDGHAIRNGVYPLDTAAEGGHLDLVKYMHEVMHLPGTSQGLKITARCGYFDILKYYIENEIVDKTKLNYPDIIQSVARTGHLDIIKYIHQLCPDVITDVYGAVCYAVINDHFHVLKYLHEEMHFTGKEHFIEEAAKYSSVEIVKYLYEKMKLTGTSKAVDYAACRGRQVALPLVVYLHETVGLTGTSKAVDSAALYGNLELVKYLHEQMHLVGSSSGYNNAIDAAISGGHLNIVIYLHKKMGLPGTINSIPLARYKGHTDIITYLYDEMHHQLN